MDQYVAHRTLSDADYASWGKPKAPYKGKKGGGWYVVREEKEILVVLEW